MCTDLKTLIEVIDPSKTIDPFERQINEAYAKFTLTSNTVSSVDECHQVLSDLIRIGRNAAFNAPEDAGDCLLVNYWEAMVYLPKEFPQSTELTVIDIMISGQEGGVHYIMNVLAREMAFEYSRNVIDSHVMKFWDSLSWDEKLALPEKYIKEYGYLLPKHIQKEYKVLCAKMWEVLAQHPRMVKTYRDKF